MKKTIITLAVLSLASMLNAQIITQHIQTLSFEDPTVSSSASVASLGATSDWTANNGSSFIVNNSSPLGIGNADDGVQQLYFTQDESPITSVTRDITLLANQRYLVQAYRRTVNNPTGEIVAATITIDNESFILGKGDNYWSTRGNLYFTGPNTSQTLTISVTDWGADSGIGFAVDNIILTPMPEPSSALLLGFGGLGLLARRRR